MHHSKVNPTLRLPASRTPGFTHPLAVAEPPRPPETPSRGPMSRKAGRRWGRRAAKAAGADLVSLVEDLSTPWTRQCTVLVKLVSSEPVLVPDLHQGAIHLLPVHMGDLGMSLNCLVSPLGRGWT